jgi:hypothetical protein
VILGGFFTRRKQYLRRHESDRQRSSARRPFTQLDIDNKQTKNANNQGQPFVPNAPLGRL